MHRETRPWGYFDLFYTDDNQWFKRLVISPGQSLSLQYHENRMEFWLTQDQGVLAHIESDGADFTLIPGHVYVVPEYDVHRLSNPTEHEVVVTEWATGKPDENDIVRLEDRYGRLDKQ